jgi:hypothetical protein
MFFNYLNMSSYGPNSTTPSPSLPPASFPPAPTQTSFAPTPASFQPAPTQTSFAPTPASLPTAPTQTSFAPTPASFPPATQTLPPYNNIGGYTITLPIIQPLDGSTISTDSNNQTLSNLNIKETIDAHKESHRFLISNLPAKNVLNSLGQYRFNSAGYIAPPCGAGSTSGCPDETASSANYTDDQLAAIKNDLNLAQKVQQGFGLALTDPFGVLHTMYQENKFFTMSDDGNINSFATSDPGNLSNIIKSKVTNSKFIEFFKHMKTHN